MKRLLLVSLLAIFVPSAFAQMGQGYSGYTNYSVDANNDIFVTAVLDGASSCNYVPPGMTCARVHHSGDVSVSMDSVTTETVGQPATVNAYISVSNTGTITNAPPGTEHKIGTIGKILCSVAGAIVVFVQRFNGGISLSNLQWDGQPPSGNVGNTCNFDLQCYGTGPPVCPILTLAEISILPITSCPADGKPFRWITEGWTSVDGNVTCLKAGARFHQTEPTPCQ